MSVKHVSKRELAGILEAMGTGDGIVTFDNGVILYVYPETITRDIEGLVIKYKCGLKQILRLE